MTTPTQLELEEACYQAWICTYQSRVQIITEECQTYKFQYLESRALGICWLKNWPMKVVNVVGAE